MTTMDLPLVGGWTNGPLFDIKLTRGPKRYGTVLQGRIRRQSEKRATPLWADRKAIADIWKESRRLTAETGVQYSVDHTIPLLHPLVCGLHVQGNLEIMTLKANIAKSNHTWPDMWVEQLELL